MKALYNIEEADFENGVKYNLNHNEEAPFEMIKMASDLEKKARFLRRQFFHQEVAHVISTFPGLKEIKLNISRANGKESLKEFIQSFVWDESIPENKVKTMDNKINKEIAKIRGALGSSKEIYWTVLTSDFAIQEQTIPANKEAYLRACMGDEYVSFLHRKQLLAITPREEAKVVKRLRL